MQRIASIDFGVKRIGLALSDPSQIIASPLEVVLACKTPEATLEKIVKTLEIYDLEAIVVGYPLHLDGKIGSSAKLVSDFVSRLEPQVPCPVILLDERFSTVIATRALMEGGMSRKKRTQVLDAITASLILQTYLDRVDPNSQIG